MAMGWMFVTNLGSEVGILVVVLLDDGVRDWDGSDGYDIRLLSRFGLCLPIDVPTHLKWRLHIVKTKIFFIKVTPLFLVIKVQNNK